MEKADPIKKLTMKLGAICEDEPPAVCLGALTTVFACLTMPQDEEGFKAAVQFFGEAAGEIRKQLKGGEEEKPAS